MDKIGQRTTSAILLLRDPDDLLATLQGSSIYVLKAILNDITNHEALRLSSIIYRLPDSMKRGIIAHVIHFSLHGGISIGQYKTIFREFSNEIQTRALLLYTRTVSLQRTVPTDDADFCWEFYYLLLLARENHLDVSSNLIQLGRATGKASVSRAIDDYLG